uniref:DUF4113 domain-containing protein n=1 Tax=Pseudomonas profundi TaxID=1981513 RepID=UPI00123BBF38
MIKTALDGLDRIYKKGPAYAKASILLMDLCDREQLTPGLFEPAQPLSTDEINGRWRRGTIRPGRLQRQFSGDMQRNHLSPAYTTKLSELFTVKDR